ncbi:hypothetical protein EVA_22234 [gut metagenome]|uniref:Uncharacterized protein n=1 Tax=gut metagenome TaxID=749906 RepID=J9FQK3_9ZZZZ
MVGLAVLLYGWQFTASIKGNTASFLRTSRSYDSKQASAMICYRHRKTNRKTDFLTDFLQTKKSRYN